MQIRPVLALAVALSLATLAACGPIPGGSLAGKSVEIPADWSSALGGDRGLCEIEARPADPHSIQLECFVYEGALYAQSHRWAQARWWPVTSWAEVWLEHPDVKVRIGDGLYALTAAPVTDAADREALLAHRGYAPPPAGIVVFRFDPRAPTPPQ